MHESSLESSQDPRPELSRQIPDPNGPPVASPETSMETLVSLGLYATAGGIAVCMLSAMMLPAVGATRSSRLLKDQRDQEVAGEIAALESDPIAKLLQMPATLSEERGE